MTEINVEVIQPSVLVQHAYPTVGVEIVGGRGSQGDSAYMVALSQGFVGTEQEWLDSLVGPTGAVYQGPWADATAYVLYDFVTHNTDSYICIADHTSVIADDEPGVGTNWTSKWELFLPGGTDGADGAGVPAGGTTGQVLEKIDGTDYNTQWADPAIALPAGGTTGQILEKTDGTDYNVQWADPVSGLPLASDKNFVVYSTNNIAKGALVDNGPLTITCNNTTWGSPDNLKVQDGSTHKVGGYGNWVMFDFGSAVTLYSWVMTGHSSKYITSLRWEYSDDGVNFTALETFSDLGVGPYEKLFVDREQSHRWWRYVLLGGASAGEGEVDYVGFYVSDISGEWISKTPSEALGLLVPGGTIGQVLEKQSATDGDATWVDPTTPPSALDDLTDVDLTTTAPQTDDVLTYDGAGWVPGQASAVAALDDLTDVNAPTPSTGQALVWSGAEWAPSDVASGGSNFAEDIGAVTANTPVTVTHNLGTMDVVVEVFEKDAAAPGAAAGSVVEPQVTLVDVNSLELTFAENAVANLYRVVISSGGGGGTVESASFLHGRRFTSDQSITGSVTTTAVFNDVVSSFGTDLSLNTSTGEITVNRSGVYVLSAAIEATTTSTDARVWVYVDGSAALLLGRRRLMEVYRDIGGTGSLYLNEGSVVTFEVNIYGNSGIRASSYFTISGPMYGGGSSGGSTDMTAVRQFTFLMMGA